MTNYVDKQKLYTAIKYDGTNAAAIAALTDIATAYKSLDGNTVLLINNYNGEIISVYNQTWIVAQQRQDSQEGYIWPPEVWDQTSFEGRFEEE